MVQADKSWIGCVFAECGGQLRAFLQRRVRNSDEIADLAQEVYLRLLRLPDSATVANPESYLFAVAGNLVKEQAVLARRFAQSVAHDAPEVEIDLALDPAFEAEVDTELRAKRLRQVLAELSPKCRAAVVLHYRDGMSHGEIGRRLGISTPMVKKYRNQALLHCRRRMELLR
jgi:RNA polymerase sigma factor (sigma-70 family)